MEATLTGQVHSLQGQLAPFDPDRWELESLLAGAGGQLELPIGSEMVSIELASPESPLPYPEFKVRIHLDEALVDVFLPQETVNFFCRNHSGLLEAIREMIGAGESEEHAEAFGFALICLQYLLERDAPELAETIELHSIAKAEMLPGACIGLAISASAERHQEKLPFAISAEAADLQSLFPGNRPDQDDHYRKLAVLRTIPLFASVCADLFWAKEEDLAAWAEGSALVLKPDWQNQCWLLASQHCCPVVLSSFGVEGNGRFDPIAPPEAPPQPEAFSEPRENRMDQHEMLDLPVLVTLELKREKMTLEDLLALNSGGSISIGEFDDQNVSIRVNGTLYGQGRLVELDQKVAVQITEISGDAV